MFKLAVQIKGPDGKVNVITYAQVDQVKRERYQVKKDSIVIELKYDAIEFRISKQMIIIKNN